MEDKTAITTPKLKDEAEVGAGEGIREEVFVGVPTVIITFCPSSQWSSTVQMKKREPFSRRFTASPGPKVIPGLVQVSYSAIDNTSAML